MEQTIIAGSGVRVYEGLVKYADAGLSVCSAMTIATLSARRTTTTKLRSSKVITASVSATADFGRLQSRGYFMRVVDEIEFTVEEMTWPLPDGQISLIPRTLVQKTVEPTTQRELLVLRSGNCPVCGSTLAGNNGKFCVPDQIWWVFETDKPAV